MSKVVTVEATPAESPTHRFYRTVWRWHFYAGLFVIPFMLVLAITGAIYLFKPQLDAVFYHDLMVVSPAQTALPYTQQLASVQQVYPDATATKFTPSVAANRSAEVGLTTADERHLTVFVNPYTGQVLGERDEDLNFQTIIRKLHGELMIGKIGDYLVELASCWGLVLLISGLYLWLPRRGFRIGGTLLPRFWSRNRRLVWRDLHAVSGFYGALLIAFLILTGLPWAGFWGETFVRVWDQFPSYVFSDPPSSTVLTGTLNQQGAQTVPWAVERLPMPQSTAGHAQHQSPKPNLDPSQKTASGSPVTLDTVVALAKAEKVASGFSVSLPQEATGVYTVSVFPNDPRQERTLHIDQYSGQVLADVGWQEYALVPKAVEMGIAIHMGKYFGTANQLLMLLACLIVVLLCVSGVIMWWQRRPTGRLGAPALPAYVQQWRIPVVIIAVLGLIFPLVGFSLLVVLLLDYLVIDRVPGLRRLLN
ncbi:MAG: PepSY domain-containing protein [Synechococcales cyanobacterium M58_A2018_015]|nr:PepSY domain-containing protein [Synechococcales cyanobacterium M58_A2018_015]